MDTKSRSKRNWQLVAISVLAAWFVSPAVAEPKRLPVHDDAEEIARIINLIFGEEDSVSFDESTNTLLIPSDPPELTANIEELASIISPERPPWPPPAIQLLYTDAEEVAALEWESVEPRDYQVHALKRTNSVLVTARPEQAKIIENLIRSFDESQKPDYSVYVSAVLLRVQLDDQISSGADLLRSVPDFKVDGETIHIADHYRPGSGGAVIHPPSLGNTERNAWSEIGEYFNFYIDALEQSENCEILSRPFVFVADGESGRVHFDERIAVPNSTISTLSDLSETREFSDWEKSRSFQITPTVTSSRTLTMSVQFDRESTPNPEPLTFSTGLHNRDIIAFSSETSAPDEDPRFGISQSDRVEYLRGGDQGRYEHLLLLQAHIIERSEDLIASNTEKVTRQIVGEEALEIDPSLFPESAETPVENLLKRKLKYMPALDFLSHAATAIAGPSGIQFEVPTRKPEAESILVGETLLVADPGTNHIVISGTPEDVKLVTALADEVDVRPRSVYISAVIAQVELGNDLRYGMDILRTVDEIKVDDEVVDVKELYRTGTGGTTIIDLPALGDANPTPNLATYVENVARQSGGRLKILERSHLFMGNDQPAAIRSSLAKHPSLNVDITPQVTSENRVILELRLSDDIFESLAKIDGGRVQNLTSGPLSTSVELEEGMVLVDQFHLLDNGESRREMLLFLQPKIVAPDSNGFANWAELNLPDGGREFDGDSDADDIPNCIEYVFGGRAIISPAVGQLTAPPETVPADVTLSLEVSGDLQNWTEILRYEAGRLIRQVEGVRIESGIVIDDRIGSRDSGFYRYRASQ